MLAVAGTHGKTTTASLLAWILEHAGLDPGFLIGGVPANFGASARLGATPFFVIEADEYDTRVLRQARQVRALPAAHADPQQPRVRPRRHLPRRRRHPAAVPSPGAHRARQRPHRLERRRRAPGARRSPWAAGRRSRASPARGRRRRRCGRRGRWPAPRTSRASRCSRTGASHGTVEWGLIGAHNVENALAAIAAARHAGVPVAAGDRGAAELPGHRAAHAAARRGCAACASTTTSRTTRPRSPRPSTGCAAAWARHASSRCSSRARNTMRMGVHRRHARAGARRRRRGVALHPARPRLGRRRGRSPRSATRGHASADVGDAGARAGGARRAPAITCWS